MKYLPIANSLLTLLLIAMVLNSKLFNQPNTSIQSNVVTNESIANLSNQLSNELQILRSDITDLKAKLKSIESALATNSKANAETVEYKKTDKHSSDTNRNDKSNEMESTDEKLEKFNTVVNIEEFRSPKKYTARIKNNYESQSVDFSWAGEYQNNLSEMITNSESLYALPVKDISCKQIMCKLEVFSDDIDPFKLSQDLSLELNNQSWRNKDAPFFFYQSPINGVYEIYIGRDSESFN